MATVRHTFPKRNHYGSREFAPVRLEKLSAYAFWLSGGENSRGRKVMHGTAIENGKFFFEKFVSGKFLKGSTVVEFGSQDINGSIRQFTPDGLNYIGVDCFPGKDVDIVSANPYKVPLPDQYADIIVSSSTLEHVEFFWELFMEMVRIVKVGGLIYLNVPSCGPYHECPVDCWRFYPGAGKALEGWSRKQGSPAELIYSHITEYTFVDDKTKSILSGDEWRDWIAVFRRI